MIKADLLIELGTEELPPKALVKLVNAFRDGVHEGLTRANIEFDQIDLYATPRRLALKVIALADAQPDQEVEKRGPAVQAAFGDDGVPTKAAEGFARGCGVKVEELETMETDKGAWLVFRQSQQGAQTSALIGDIIDKSLAKLPIPKRMRWGDSTVEFVRPVHWLVVMHGDRVVDVEVLGQKAAGVTYGHRFHHPHAIELKSTQDYPAVLADKGFVVADIEIRRDAIRQSAEEAAEALSGKALIEPGLLDEVTALVEWPVAVAGGFDEEFLEVPAEALISSMQDHQKYFPVLDSNDKLLPHFITISNIQSEDPLQVQAGNERVIRPRLSDAAFFWNQDRKNPLETRMDDLDNVVFQKKLGSVGDKSRRVAKLAEKIAKMLGVNDAYAHRAGLLSKCDLMTNMVHEFTDLQGIMGRYYAQHDGEPDEVAIALDEQYMPRFAGDELPHTVTGQIIAISDKLDTLLGIFSIGQKPTGEKDPFALRRAALGVLRILIDKGLMLDLRELLQMASDCFATDLKTADTIEDVLAFMMERLRAFYADQDISSDVFDSVHACYPTTPVDFDRRIEAVQAFRKMTEAESLAAANKRIRNILKKVETKITSSIDESLLTEAAEKALFESLQSVNSDVSKLYEQGDYASALKSLAILKQPVDTFFDDVMVMVDDEKLKQNRIALLNHLSELFLHTADLSRLQ